MEPCEQESGQVEESNLALVWDTRRGIVGWAYGGEALVARLRGGSARS